MWAWRSSTAVTQITAVALGLVVLRSLTERPEDAHWLTPKQRAWHGKANSPLRVTGAAAPDSPGGVRAAFFLASP